MSESTPQYTPVPPDDLKRTLTLARPDMDQTLPHIGVVGDTYTITISSEETAGHFCVIDMHVPPSGGPPRTGMTLKRPSSCLKARWKLRSVARSPSCAPARPSTSLRTHRISSITLRRSRSVCFAFARLQGRRSSSRRWAFPWRLAPPLRPSSTRISSSSSWRKPKHLLRSIGLSSWRKRSKFNLPATWGLAMAVGCRAVT
jgi:hypothetical protein